MEVNVRIAGAAGQGIQTSADMLGKAVTRAGLFAAAWTDAQSRIRGGLNHSDIRIADHPRPAPTARVDILVVQTREALDAHGPLLGPDAIVLCQEPEWEHPRRAPFALAPLAAGAGSPVVAGVVAVAAVAALLGLDRGVLEALVRERFADIPKLAEMNLAAVDAGYGAAQGWGVRRRRLPAGDGVAGRMWISGAEALALGAVAGGASFVVGYPMSPSTGVLAALAAWSRELGIVVEQSEDEIAAINMVAGASYAGARAMTATSGGGFDLMGEGVSLLGMIEAPAVILIGQRPGPATGLPTRTAQQDLHLALHSGHGFFPRVVLAPRDVQDAFEITALTFDIAERLQVPVFVLTDQQINDGAATVAPLSVEGLPRRRHLLSRADLEVMERYRRYALTDSGVSPLAAPGASRHVVVACSDEHDEDGHIADSVALSRTMAEKRLRRAATVAREAWPLAVKGKPDGRPLVVSWGSSHAAVAEAREALGRTGHQVAHLHLRQLWPLPVGDLAALLDQASRTVVVENNLGGELATLLQATTARPVHARINRIDGRPFVVDELVERIGEAAG